ncbi:MAG: helix-turn-helix transcriptional regulator [Pseudomonadota bacterium]
MLLADALVRFPVLILLAVLLALALRDNVNGPAVRLGMVLAVASIGHGFASLPSAFQAPEAVTIIGGFFGIVAPASVWLFGLAVLNDDFRMTPPLWVVLALSCLMKIGWWLRALGVAVPFHEFHYIGTYVVTLGCIAHLGLSALRGWREDLVEKRRQGRVLIVALIAVTGLISAASELMELGPEAETFIGHALALPMVLWTFCALVSLRPAFLTHSERAPEAQTAPTGTSALDPKDQLAFDRLMQEMVEKEAFLEADLTIRGLSERLRLQEHQLRKLINTTLGYRNFAAFVNGYRIEHAQAKLADPALVGLPILTIAMDCGFQTLSTFNRAFKSAAGITPSEYRKHNTQVPTPPEASKGTTLANG